MIENQFPYFAMQSATGLVVTSTIGISDSERISSLSGVSPSKRLIKRDFSVFNLGYVLFGRSYLSTSEALLCEGSH